MDEPLAAPEALPALLMLAPWGNSAAERWVAQGRLAAAVDLVARLRQAGCFDPILALAAEPADTERLAAAGATPISAPEGPFQFGETLAGVLRRHRLTRLAYFGGASAPLATEQCLRSAFERFRQGATVVNNLHSTDWALLAAGEVVAGLSRRLPNDNALGWVLSTEAGLPVVGLPPSAATRLDLDTPTDLLLAAGHPDLGPALGEFLQQAPPSRLDRCRRIRQVLQTPASQLVLIGRTSSHAWSQLESRTQVWVRVFAEERGMLASGRLGRGEVRSVLQALAGEAGPEAVVEQLSAIAQAVLWDTRVWMAAAGGWPAAADRFASDLGWVDQIAEPGLRRLTQAIEQAPIPILAGGHGVVAGGIYALLETAQTGNFA